MTSYTDMVPGAKVGLDLMEVWYLGFREAVVELVEPIEGPRIQRSVDMCSRCCYEYLVTP
jgi:Ni,Fe-hydrogenase III large subunit